MGNVNGDRILDIITSIRSSFKLEERPSPEPEKYFEAVIQRTELKRCVDLLETNLGSPVKPFDQDLKLDKGIQKIADDLGGIWKDQCLFLKQNESQEFIFAAFWPWGSDPERITLKLGLVED